MMAITIQYGYVGIFFICLISAASILFPIPDTAVVFVLGGSLLFEPVWVAVAAASGAAVGEFTGYLLGLGGRKAMTARFGKRIDFLERIVKKYGAFAIFLFAATPLPDDLLFIPLGIMRYSVTKTFIPAFVGKLSLYLTVIFGGQFFIETIGDFFGLTNDFVPAVVSMVLGVLIFILVLKVDWERHLGKYLVKEKQHEVE